jgi:pilus assembly protein CpaF
VNEAEPALFARVRDRLAADGSSPTRARVANAVRHEAGVRGASEILAAVDTLHREFVGAGPLEPLLREPGVTDVLVNGASQVWVDRGHGLVRTGITFPDDDTVRRLAVRLAASAGRRLDDSLPCADVRLDGGVRLHAVLPPIVSPGVCLSFRVPHARGLRLDEWVTAGSMPLQAAVLLQRIVEAGLSYFVTGGTGTGKTTLLASMLGCVSSSERLVLVEDTAELRPVHPHVVRLESRPANIEGVGAIGLRTLVREALRMRPDRLIVGEVRGAECVDLLTALNVGHDGGCGTLHANAPADVPARIEALCTPAGLSREATHSQLAAGLRVVVHLDRDPAGLRRLHSIGVLQRRLDGLVEVVPAARVRGSDVLDQAGRRELDRLLASGS